MLKDLEILVVLVILLVAVIGIFQARVFVRKKVEEEKVNKIVTIVKAVLALVIILDLIVLYFVI